MFVLKRWGEGGGDFGHLFFDHTQIESRFGEFIPKHAFHPCL